MRPLPRPGLPAVILAALSVALCTGPARASTSDDALAAFAVNDLPRARRLAEPAAGKGDALGLFVLGTVLRVTGPAPKSGDENGYAPAQHQLGYMYELEFGLPRDPQKAAALWYRRAAENNQPEAQANLGVLYLTGLGVAKDEKAAAEWLGKAAEWGNMPAQATPAGMYLEGAGVAKNETEAAVLYRKAAEGGLASAQSMLGWLLQTGTGVPMDEAQAMTWYRTRCAPKSTPPATRHRRTPPPSPSSSASSVMPAFPPPSTPSATPKRCALT